MKIEGLEKLQKLEELYISHNGLETIEGLQCNVSGVTGRAYHFCGPVSLGAYGFTESKKFSTKREFVSVNQMRKENPPPIHPLKKKGPG